MLHKSTLLLLLVSMVMFYSCKENGSGSQSENQPPTTKCFLADIAVDTTVAVQQSKIHMYWSGDDPDGFVIGFYFSWDSGKTWAFTKSTDSLFALQIGAVSATYLFKVSAVDNSGNGQYDTMVTQNGINYGPEPFTDLNNNGKWDVGEPFVDIGKIDPNPATVKIPIRNTAPTISWNVLTTIPDISLPVMSFGWNASDLDGDETITKVCIALNDTNSFVELAGNVRMVTLRVPKAQVSGSQMEILIDGNPNNIATTKLSGLRLDAENIFYVRVQDVSGATSPWINSTTQSKSKKWFVKSIKGDLLVVDDYGLNDNSATYYKTLLDAIVTNQAYDVADIKTYALPYKNYTFLETIRLYKYIFWYADYNNPSLDLASATVQKYLKANGKIFFSMQFPTNIDLGQIQGFLPISADSSKFTSFLFPGTIVGPVGSITDFPTLNLSAAVPRARTFFLPSVGVRPIYYLPNNELSGYLGLESSDDFGNPNLFFIGIPLHLADGTSGTVKTLFKQVLKTRFGFSGIQ
ncbi:MAG: hypothetical protein LWX56_02785 [Ignavibacteria bacterium]|nr:hypothetical protein [Ignavibacteria bacterium]